MNRLMSLDVGDVRIGIAQSDMLGITAQQVETYTRKGASDVPYITTKAKELGAHKLVVGMPRNMNGTYGPQSEKVRAFAAKLQESFDGEVVFFDERLTTMAVERILIDADVSRKKRKKVVDKMAAVVILQNYMDCKGVN